jgi:hypothetical protein
MAKIVHTKQGLVAIDPNDWMAEAEPKRNPIDRIGPHPVQ